MADEQLDIFAPEVVHVAFDEGELLADRFDRFAAANPEVEAAIVAIARHLLRQGIKRAGIALIFERLRWLYALQTQGDVYKLNNNWRAFYARRVMWGYADLAGFFLVREQHPSSGRAKTTAQRLDNGPQSAVHQGTP